MRIKSFESILCAGVFTLAASVFPYPSFAEPEDAQFTQKFQNPNFDQEGGGDGPRQNSGGPQGKQGMGLSEEDRAKMKAIQEKLAKEADVQTAREAVQNAQSKEERQQAMKSLKEVMDKHLGAEDRKFMDKLRKQHSKNQKQGGQGRGGRQGGGSQGGAGVEGGGSQGGGPDGDNGERKQQKKRKGQRGEDGSQGGGNGPGNSGGRPGVDGLFGPEGGGGGEGSGDGPPKGRPQRGGPEDGDSDGGPGGDRPQGDGPGMNEQGSRHQGGQEGGGKPMMSDEQRQKFKSIRDKYKDDPDVKKAREAVKEAVTPEEKELAIEEYRGTIQKKMSPEDRSFLDELKKNRNRERPTQAPAFQN